MKTRGWLVAVLLFPLLTPFKGRSQCGTIHTITYDTVITGLGSSEDPYLFTFPLFDGTLGTLTDVNVSSTVTVNYDYNAENTTGSPTTFRLKITRADDIVSPLLPGGALSYSRTFPTTALNPQNATNYFSHLLEGNDGIAGSGNDYGDSSLVLLNNSTIINQAAAAANFIGTGTTTFEYYTLLGNYSVNGGNVAFNSSASDQITLSVTYTYCDNIVMAPSPRPSLQPERDTGANSRRLFPNPSYDGNFSVRFNANKRGDWEVEIFNSIGQILNRRKFYNSSKVSFNSINLTKGVYLIKSTNIKSQESFVERLIVK